MSPTSWPGETPGVAPSASERRSHPRGRLHLFWDLLFGLLRLIGRHVRGFYGAVGIFVALGGAIAILGTWAFVAFAGHVRSGATQAFDDAVMRQVALHQEELLKHVMLEVTFLGTGLVVGMIVVVSSLFLWLTRHRYSASILLVATFGAIVLNSLLKAGFDRPRPQIFQWGTNALTSSFPSGHAMSAAVVYMMVAYLAARLEAKRLLRWLVMLVAVVLVVLIAASRVYLGVHYPSDVFAGVLVGLAWAGFCIVMFDAVNRVARRAAPAEAARQELPAPREDAPAPQEVELTPEAIDRARDDAKAGRRA